MQTLQKKFLAGASSPSVSIKTADGSYVYSQDGKKYVDFTMGWCVGNLGWNNKRLTDTIKSFKGPIYVYPNQHYEAWNDLAEALCKMAPGKMTKCFRTTGGSESVDTAMQLAMAYTGRKKFLSVEDAYHGNSIGPLSIGASENRDKIPSLLPGSHKIKRPLDKKALSMAETVLRKKDVAAVILEPVLCNLGVHIPGKEFMKGLRKLCDKYDTLLVLDEVATGFGRTGKLFATEHYGIAPDILCLSKAITGGHAGMGATLTTGKIYKKTSDKVNIYSTYGWHPLSTAVALSNVRYFQENKKKILEAVEKSSTHFKARLAGLPFKQPAKLNIIGLAISVDVHDKKYAEKIKNKCETKGLLITNQDNFLIMFPALNVDSKVIDEGLDILEECL